MADTVSFDGEIADAAQLVEAGQRCSARLLGKSPSRDSGNSNVGISRSEVRRDVEALERLTSDIMGLSSWRARRQVTALTHQLPTGQRSAAKQAASFHEPTTRSWQPTTRDGRQTFHFDHSTMSKIDRRTIGHNVTDRPRSRAPNHSRYVSREEAVARIAKSAYLESATQIGAGEHALYIERSDAVATSNDRPMTYHNIDDDPDKRVEFWELTEQLERVGGKDRLTVRYREHPEFWDRVALIERCLEPDVEHDGCPDDLRRLIDDARVSGEATGPISSGEEVRRWLYQRTGTWRPTIDKGTGKKTDKCGQPGQWHDARSGRVQQRVIGSLPACLSLEGIDRAAGAIANEMRRINVTFELSVHRPSYDNDERNWHFHLDYTDRPCARLSNGAWDFAQPTIDDAIEQSPRRFGAKGKTRKKFPYRQNKTRENVASRKWIQKFRHDVANIINVELEREGHVIRYYGGSAEELGLPKGHVRHLGQEQKSAQLIGVRSLADDENEASQYAAKRQWFERLRSEEKAEAHQRYNQQVRKIGVTPLDAFSAAYDAHTARKAAADFAYLASCARDDCERLTSRPDLLLNRLPRYIDAINAGTAKPHDCKREELYRMRLAEAQAARLDVEPYVVEQKRIALKLEEKARAARLMADSFERQATEIAAAHRAEAAMAPKESKILPAVPPSDVNNSAARLKSPTLPPALTSLTPAVAGVSAPPARRTEPEPSEVAKNSADVALQTAIAAVANRDLVPEVSRISARSWLINVKDPRLRATLHPFLDHPELIKALQNRRDHEIDQRWLDRPRIDQQLASAAARQDTVINARVASPPLERPVTQLQGDLTTAKLSAVPSLPCPEEITPVPTRAPQIAAKGDAALPRPAPLQTALTRPTPGLTETSAPPAARSEAAPPKVPNSDPNVALEISNTASPGRNLVPSASLDDRGLQIEATNPRLQAKIEDSGARSEPIKPLSTERNLAIAHLGLGRERADPQPATAIAQQDVVVGAPAVPLPAVQAVTPAGNLTIEPPFLATPPLPEAIAPIPTPAPQTAADADAGAIPPVAQRTPAQAPIVPRENTDTDLFELAMERIAHEGDRIEEVAGRLRLSEDAMRELQLTPAILDDEHRQRRLAGRRVVQERDARRLLAFVRAHPTKVALAHKRISLVPGAPADIVQILERNGRNEELRDAIRAVVEATGAAEQSTSSKAASGPDLGALRPEVAVGARDASIPQPADVVDDPAAAAARRRQQQAMAAAARSGWGR